MHGRAIRRHQQRVARARARRLLALWGVPPTPARVGRHSCTRVTCSCWMCGNPRKYTGDRTRQELLADCRMRTGMESVPPDETDNEEDRANV
jgi:hypothetical protein